MACSSMVVDGGRPWAERSAATNAGSSRSDCGWATWAVGRVGGAKGRRDECRVPGRRHVRTSIGQAFDTEARAGESGGRHVRDTRWVSAENKCWAFQLEEEDRALAGSAYRPRSGCVSSSSRRGMSTLGDGLPSVCQTRVTVTICK
jgi:hypothetical protein